MKNLNYYERLEISNTASKEEIKKAYKKCVKKFHPDLNKNFNSNKNFHSIKEAYENLIDSKKKKEYDENILKNKEKNHIIIPKTENNIEENFINILKIFLIIFSLYIVPSLIFQGVSFFIKSENYTNLISNFIFLGLLIFIYKKSIIEEFKIFRKDFWKCAKTGYKYWLIGLIGMIISNLIINVIIFKGNISNNEELVRNVIIKAPVFSFISAVVIGPLIEEIIFRKSFRNAFKNVVVFVITSGFFFGLLHATTAIETPLSLLYILPYGILGSCFAIAYSKTKTIFTPILAHATHNLIMVLLVLLFL